MGLMVGTEDAALMATEDEVVAINMKMTRVIRTQFTGITVRIAMMDRTEKPTTLRLRRGGMEQLGAGMAIIGRTETTRRVALTTEMAAEVEMTLTGLTIRLDATNLTGTVIASMAAGVRTDEVITTREEAGEGLPRLAVVAAMMGGVMATRVATFTKTEAAALDAIVARIKIGILTSVVATKMADTVVRVEGPRRVRSLVAGPIITTTLRTLQAVAAEFLTSVLALGTDLGALVGRLTAVGTRVERERETEAA